MIIPSDTKLLLTADNSKNEPCLPFNLSKKIIPEDKKQEVTTYLLHARKVQIVNKILSASNNEEIKNNDNYIIGFENLSEELKNIPAEKIIKETKSLHNWVRSWNLFFAGSVATISFLAMVLANKESILWFALEALSISLLILSYSHASNIDKKDNFYRQTEKVFRDTCDTEIRFSDIKNFGIKHANSPLKKINLFFVFRYLYNKYQFQQEQILALTKALYVGVMSTWMDMLIKPKNTHLNTESDCENQEFIDDANAKIVINTINAMILDSNLINCSSTDKKSAVEKSACQIASEILEEKMKANVTIKKITVNLMEKQQQLESLSTGFYCVLHKSGNKNNLNYTGVIRVDKNNVSIPTYIYYQPVNELEYSTDDSQRFTRMLYWIILTDFRICSLDKATILDDIHVEEERLTQIIESE